MELATSSVTAIMRDVARWDDQAASGMSCPNKTVRLVILFMHKTFLVDRVFYQGRPISLVAFW